nr:hypothetical protein B0A51_12795 [Rachicladosporium sp. CCFEE 5018]
MAPHPPQISQPAARQRHDLDAEFRQRLRDSITTIDPVTGRRRWTTNAEINSRGTNRQTNAESQELRRRYHRGHEPEEHEAVILDRLYPQHPDRPQHRAAFTADELWAEHDAWVAEHDASSTAWSSSSSDADDTWSQQRPIETPSHAERGDGNQGTSSLEVNKPDASSKGNRRTGGAKAQSVIVERGCEPGTTLQPPV